MKRDEAEALLDAYLDAVMRPEFPDRRASVDARRYYKAFRAQHMTRLRGEVLDAMTGGCADDEP